MKTTSSPQYPNTNADTVPIAQCNASKLQVHDTDEASSPCRAI
jgi:hypothetical protein